MTASASQRVYRWGPVALLLGLVCLWPVLGFDGDSLLAWVRDHNDTLVHLVTGNPLTAAGTFVLAYAVGASISLPIATLATLTGGYLFGVWYGAALSLGAATVGAVAVFYFARTGHGGGLLAGAEGRAARMADGFRQDAFTYLLFLRLAPVFPFWLVNLVPAVAGVAPRTYIAASILGMAPGSFAIAAMGDAVFWMVLNSERAGLEILFSPQLLGPLIGLGVLSLLPVGLQRHRRRRKKATV